MNHGDSALNNGHAWDTDGITVEALEQIKGGVMAKKKDKKVDENGMPIEGAQVEVRGEVEAADAGEQGDAEVIHAGEEKKNATERVEVKFTKLTFGGYKAEAVYNNHTLMTTGHTVDAARDEIKRLIGIERQSNEPDSVTEEIEV